MAEAKHKGSESLRTPKPKKKLGLTVPPALRMPHDDLILSEPSTIQSPEKETKDSQTSHSRHTSQTSTTTIPTMTSLTSHSIESVSPQKDFTKVANSIGREAVPAGLFSGKSKQLYDCLYSLTRGAVVPRRTIRISRPKLMSKAHIGARATFDANIERLIKVGLINVRQITGEHEGNEYTVFLPEEIEESMASQTSLTSLTSHAQKLDRLVRLETSQTRHTLSAKDSEVCGESKTFFKTKDINDDDEAFADFIAVMSETAKNITGRTPSRTEKERWGELAEVLSTELMIAAGRTTISSAPAFLAEHLRRRLWKKDKGQIESETSVHKSDLKQKIDTSQCPDCFGTGMWYPEGFDNGVARCEHKSLKQE